MEVADREILQRAEKAALHGTLGIADGDIVFFAAAPWEKACAILGRIRLEARLLQKRGKLTIRPDDWNFLWVVDFPLMTFDEEEKRYVATHHPFTAPVPEDAASARHRPEKVRGQHYDVVLNGMELGGGSIRIHQPALQKKVFEDVLKIPPTSSRAVSATCCGRSPTARRRTAASPSASTAWWRCSAARRASAT
jgi:aspartyl-tRNA synthetase